MSQNSESGLSSVGLIRLVLRCLKDQRDPQKLREFIRWLEPGDVMQTEHIFIVAALKRMVDSGQELTLPGLEEVLLPEDEAGFIRMVIQATLADSDFEWSSDGHGFDQYRSSIGAWREERDAALVEEKRRAVQVARGILEGGVELLLGAQELQWVGSSHPDPDGQGFHIFYRLANRAKDHPQGEVRKHWAPSALAEADEELERTIRDARPEMEMACQRIIRLWGDL